MRHACILESRDKLLRENLRTDLVTKALGYPGAHRGPSSRHVGRKLLQPLTQQLNRGLVGALEKEARLIRVRVRVWVRFSNRGMVRVRVRVRVRG